MLKIIWILNNLSGWLETFGLYKYNSQEGGLFKVVIHSLWKGNRGNFHLVIPEYCCMK